MKPIQTRINFNSSDRVNNLFDKENSLTIQANIKYTNGTIFIKVRGVDYYGYVYTKSAVLLRSIDDEFVNFQVSAGTSGQDANSTDLLVVGNESEADTYFMVHKAGEARILVINSKGIYLLLPYDITDGEYTINVSPADVVFPITANNVTTKLPLNTEKLSDSDRFSFSLNDNSLYIYYTDENIIDEIVNPNRLIRSINGVTSPTGSWAFSYNLNFIKETSIDTIKGRTFTSTTAISNPTDFIDLPIYSYKQLPEGMTGIEKRNIVINNYDFSSEDLSTELDATVYHIETTTAGSDTTPIDDVCNNDLSYDNALNRRAFITYWPIVSKIGKKNWDALVTDYNMATRNGVMAYNNMGIMEFINTNDITYDTYYPTYIYPEYDTSDNPDNPDNPDGQCTAAASVEIEMSTVGGVNLSGYWLAKGGTVNGGKIWVQCGDDTYKIFPSEPNSNIYAVSQTVVSDGQVATGVLFYIETSDGTLANSTASGAGLTSPPSTWQVTAISDYSICICSGNITYGGLYVDDSSRAGSTADGQDKSLYYVKYTDSSFALHWKSFEIQVEEDKYYTVVLPTISNGDSIYAYIKYDPNTYDGLCAFDICSANGGPTDIPCPEIEGKSEEELEVCHNREIYIDSNGNIACHWVYDDTTSTNPDCPPPETGEPCDCEEGGKVKYVLNSDGSYSCYCVYNEPPPEYSSSDEFGSSSSEDEFGSSSGKDEFGSSSSDAFGSSSGKDEPDTSLDEPSTSINPPDTSDNESEKSEKSEDSEESSAWGDCGIAPEGFTGIAVSLHTEQLSTWTGWTITGDLIFRASAGVGAAGTPLTGESRPRYTDYSGADGLACTVYIPYDIKDGVMYTAKNGTLSGYMSFKAIQAAVAIPSGVCDKCVVAYQEPIKLAITQVTLYYNGSNVGTSGFQGEPAYTPHPCRDAYGYHYIDCSANINAPVSGSISIAVNTVNQAVSATASINPYI